MTVAQRPGTQVDGSQEAGALPPTGSAPPPSSGPHHHHRRWPWVIGGLTIFLVAAAAVFFLVDWFPAHQVSMGQAEQRLGNAGQGVAGGRPARGVYLYMGSGTDKLSLPPLTQAQGPTMPGTVTYQGNNCWTFRVDYSSHHWQTWRFCRQANGDTTEVGGKIWQLWPVGALRESNTTNLTCTAGTMWLPANATAGQTWRSHCRGTSSAVPGVMHSDGPYRFVRNTTLEVAGKPVPTAQFLQLRTETGAQRGTERDEFWVDTTNGLPVKMYQNISVVTATPFGTSTYTQVGTMTLRSLVAHH
jgi:hypothetical protein